jgi:hypothetical protein
MLIYKMSATSNAFNHLSNNLPTVTKQQLAAYIKEIMTLQLGDVTTIDELIGLTNRFTLQSVVDVVTDLNANGKLKAIFDSNLELLNFCTSQAGGVLNYTTDNVLDENQLIKILKAFSVKHYLLQPINSTTLNDSVQTILNCSFIDSVGSATTDVPVKLFKSLYDLAAFFVSLDLNLNVFITILEKQNNMQCTPSAVATLTDDLVLYMKLVILTNTNSTSLIKTNYFAAVLAVTQDASGVPLGITEPTTFIPTNNPSTYITALQYLITKPTIIGNGIVIFSSGLFTWRTYINESNIIVSNTVLNDYILVPTPTLLQQIFDFTYTLQNVDYNNTVLNTFNSTSASLSNTTSQYIVTCYVCSKIRNLNPIALLTLISGQTLDIDSLIYFNVYFPNVINTLSIDTLLNPNLCGVNNWKIASTLWLKYIVAKVLADPTNYNNNCNLAQQIFNSCSANAHLPTNPVMTYIDNINQLSVSLDFNIATNQQLFNVDSFLQTVSLMNAIVALITAPAEIITINTTYDYLINNLLVLPNNATLLHSTIQHLYYINASSGSIPIYSMLNNPIINDIIYNKSTSLYTQNTMNLSLNTITTITLNVMKGYEHKYLTEYILNPTNTISNAAAYIKAFSNISSVYLQTMITYLDQNNLPLTQSEIERVVLIAVYANATDAVQPSTLFLTDIKTILSTNDVTFLRNNISVININANTVINTLLVTSEATTLPLLTTPNALYTAFMKNLIFNSVNAAEPLVTSLFTTQNRSKYLNAVMTNDYNILHLPQYYNQYIVLEAGPSTGWVNANSIFTTLKAAFPVPLRVINILTNINNWTFELMGRLPVDDLQNDESIIPCNLLWVLAFATLSSSSSVLADALLTNFGGKVLFSYKYVTYLVSQQGTLTKQETLYFNPVNFSPFSVQYNLGLKHNNLIYNNLITSRAPFEITANEANNVATYYADATKGVDVAGGWQFTSALAQDGKKNTKINWYMYQPITDMVITDLTNNPTNTYYTIVDNVGVEFPMIYIYTKPTVPATKTPGGIMGSSWYQSKFVYQANQVGTVGTYLLYVGADPTTIRPDLTHINLRQLDTLCMGTLQPNEIVMWAALMTSSNLDSPVGNFSFTMSKFGVVIADL